MNVPLPPSMTLEKIKDIELLSESFGINDKTVSRLMEKYKTELTTLRDSGGVLLAARAVQMNDGEALSAFLEKGLDVNQAVSLNSNQSIYDYAKLYQTTGGREPYAWNAMESYVRLKEVCPVAMLTSQDIEALQEPNYSGDTVKLYHGTRSGSSERDLTYILDHMASTGVKEVSGTPTLSTVPLGQFFSPGAVGFCYELPRELVNIDSEDKPGAVVWIDSKSNIARIQTENKTLPFSDYPCNALYRPCLISREVYPSYGPKKDETGSFDRVCEGLGAEQVKLLREIQSKVSIKWVESMANKEKSHSMQITPEPPSALNQEAPTLIAPKSLLANKINAMREKSFPSSSDAPRPKFN